MKRATVLARSALVASLLSALAACATTTHERASDDVRALLQAQEDAWNRGELEQFMSLGYWRDPELTFYSGGTITKGYDATLARYVARYRTGDAEMGRLTFDGIEVLPLGDEHALARGKWKLDFERTPDVEGLFTLVLQRDPAGWRVHHDHSSADAPPVDPKRVFGLGYTD